MLTSLSQIAHVIFDLIQEVGKREIPFVGQPVTPLRGPFCALDSPHITRPTVAGIAWCKDSRSETEVRPVIGVTLMTVTFAPVDRATVADRRPCVDSRAMAL